MSGMQGGISNPLLQQAEAKIESQLTPDNQQNYLKIVVAGQHAALANGPNSLLAQLGKSQDPIADAAKGAVSLVLILRKQAQGVMPLKAMVPAGMTLLIKALDFLDRSKIMPIGENELVRATKIFTDTIFARFGISKAGLQNAATKIHGFTNDPDAMQKIQMKAGLIRHPLAATPTPLPPGPSDQPADLMNGSAGGDETP